MSFADKWDKFIYHLRGFDVAQASIDEIDDGLETPDDVKALCRKAAAEGCLLLKNDNGLLPIKKDEKIALFGRCQYDYFYVGYGSGGDVKYTYLVSPNEGLKNAGVLLDKELSDKYKLFSDANYKVYKDWGTWPTYIEEMPISYAEIEAASTRNDKAIVFIGRGAGEDKETVKEPGSWYLTDAEHELLSNVTKAFSKVIVVVNSGCIIDVSWIEKYNISAVLFSWQAGQESGNGLADIITGAVNPSGRLFDTVANIEDYPSTANFGQVGDAIYAEDIYVGYRYFETFAKDKVIYPFGYGLSYTEFKIVGSAPVLKDGVGTIKATVTNIGSVPGKQVVFAFVACPQGKLGKPARQLVAFAKTNLLQPQESTEVVLSYNISDFSSYDDTGVTVYRNAYVLEPGDYEFYLGSNIRNASYIGAWHLDMTVIRKTENALRPQIVFDRIVNRDGKLVYEPIDLGEDTMKKRIIANLPKELPTTGNRDINLIDVKNGKYTMDEFIAQLKEEELEALTRGSLEGMYSVLGAPGNTGVFGGVSDALRHKGVPAVCTDDGPSGVRLQAHSTLFPIGACLASSCDTWLAYEIGAALGKEVIDRKSHVLLAPGLNIHRNPLCGRNFEYYSEDPIFSGKMATYYIKGVQSQGASATPKHFACNNQETDRNHMNSVVSTRALREIYLRGFEMCIRDAQPDCLMNSYNKVNGYFTCQHYDLNTEILRREFGFKGVLMTDWWIVKERSKDFHFLNHHAFRVRSGNNLFMPGSNAFISNMKVDQSIFKSLRHSKHGGLTLGELQESARYVLNYCMKYL